MDERQLYQQMKTGNQTAFDQLFQLYYEKLVRIAYQKTQDISIAEDIVQTVFIDFWTKKNDLVIEKSIFGYLNRMVHNRCIDYFRKQTSIQNTEYKYAKKSLNLSVLSPEEGLLNQENLNAIYAQIEALPTKCKIVFKLSRFEEMKYEEIAEQLAISKKTVEYHISTALKLLRKRVFGILVLFLFLSFH